MILNRHCESVKFKPNRHSEGFSPKNPKNLWIATSLADSLAMTRKVKGSFAMTLWVAMTNPIFRHCEILQRKIVAIHD